MASAGIYTFKVEGSSPSTKTMKEKISDYYKNKGFDVVYVAINKEPRRVATLRNISTKEMTSMSYAKYLYTSFYKTDLSKDIEVDHVNGNKMDDRIENLQAISKIYNRQKDHIRKEMVLLQCPICNKEFLFPKGNLSTHPNPCCSKKCGYIKVANKLKNTSKKCKLCGNVIKNYTTGKKYCSNECREKDKNYPTFNEITEQYQKLGTWKKVAEFFNVSYKIIQSIRKENINKF